MVLRTLAPPPTNPEQKAAVMVEGAGVQAGIAQGGSKWRPQD
ncbi:MAG: hypothetical protein ACOZF2_15550 [Thermodesulfobacteriota bacterium]